jgi:3-keto-5-aminohexanoate cleavage enzyme
VSTTPVIIEAAINGATPKQRNPNVPRGAAEVTADALACFAAGAAIVHNHLDRFGLGDPETTAELYLEGWRPVLAERPDALVYPTVDFGPAGVSYDHLRPLVAADAIRVGLCDPGSVNLGGADEGGPTGGFVYANSFDLIGATFDLHTELGLGPSLAIYEPGFLQASLAFQRAGRLPQGSMVKFYFSSPQGLTGAPFGLSPTVKALDAYLELLEGSGLPWAVSLAGGDVVASAVARAAVERGGHLHVGLEFFGGDREPTNAELVSEAVALCESIGRPVATPDDTAEILDLPSR